MLEFEIRLILLPMDGIVLLVMPPLSEPLPDAFPSADSNPGPGSPAGSFMDMMAGSFELATEHDKIINLAGRRDTRHLSALCAERSDRL